MKITPTLRFLLVAMCLCMVFSLFACAEETTTVTDSPATDAPTEEKTEEKTEAPTSEKTEAPTDEPTETEEPTDAPCAHEEVVLEGKAATCTEAGLTEGKKCSKCDEILVAQEEIPATGHTEVKVDAVAPTCQATGLTEGKKCSVCDAVLTAQEEVAIDPNAHNMDNGTPAEAAKCGDKATVTYKCQNEGCTHTNVVEGEVLAHDMDEGTVTTAPTCTEKGVKTFTCKRNCGHTTTEEVAELGHDMDEGSVTTAPTCTDKGVKTFTCKRNCGHSTTEEIPAAGHGTPAADAVWTVDASAPQIEKTKCPNCDAMVTREATKTTAGFTVLGPEALMKCTDNRSYIKTVETENGMKYYHMVLSADNKEGNVTINDGTKAMMGVEKYVFVIARKKGTGTTVQLYLNAAGTTDHKGAPAPTTNINVNAGWQLLIFDFSKAAQMSTENGIGWTRLDAIDGTNDVKGAEFDIAAFGFAASKEEAHSYFGKYVKAYGIDCPHMETAESTYVQVGDKHGIACGLCGEAMSTSDHVLSSDITYDESTKTYAGKCVCGAEAHSAFLHKVETDPSVSTTANLAIEKLVEDGEDFVRFNWTGAAGEAYTMLYANGSALTGNIMVVKYRAPKGANPGKFSNCHLASCANSKNPGDGTYNGFDGTVLVADGEWHYMIIDLAGRGAFEASSDGKYYARYIRCSWSTSTYVDDNGETKNAYLDIAFVAFADNIDAVDNFVVNNATAPEYTVNFDQSSMTIDGEVFHDASVWVESAPVVLDLTGKNLKTASSLKVGGWVCTRGGVAAYKYRVVKANGTVIEVPVLKDWGVEATNRTGDMYEAIGKNRLYTKDCDLGASIVPAAIVLDEFAGQVVDVEIIAITNGGAELLISQITNITVPGAAQ